MKPENPFEECIRRGIEKRENMKRTKYIMHKKFMKCFSLKENKINHRHPNAEMI